MTRPDAPPTSMQATARSLAARAAPEQPSRVEESEGQPEHRVGGAYPMYFGQDDAPLFGWLHPPAAATPAELGLVICNPFGNEAICTHRSMRHLAEHAASEGIPTIRFDYAGAGDSAGHDFEPDRVSAWVASIGAAADELRESAGVTRICLLGIRLGAALAVLAAAKRADIAALIAVAPVVKGKSYVRELRMLQRATEAKRNITRGDDADTVETAGFALTAPTQAALSEIDLIRLTATPAARVLILDRAELPGGERWEEHLRDSGARVERLSVAGFTEMMLDSHESVVPRQILSEAIRWLGALRDEKSTGAAGNAEPPSYPSHSARTRAPGILLPPPAAIDPVLGENPPLAVRESAVTFGSRSTLFAIVAAPAENMGALVAKRRGIILLNSGAIHHIGPNRLYVGLARRLAHLGHVVLRMDIGGIGDSPTPVGAEENAVYPGHAVADVAAAVQYLREEWNIQDVRAAGLCSGAYHAFKAAAARLPLSGIVLINPLTFFWKEGMSLKYPEHRVAADIMRYRTNVLRPAAWVKLLSGRVDLWESSQILLRRATILALTPLRNVARSIGAPLRNDLPSELQSIVRAKIELQFVFAGQDPGVELLRDQGGAIARRLRAEGTLRIESIDGADHTFTDRALRASLVTVLERALCG
jgi:alpha-beta hydrolase superfamily lysophospholipase